MAELTEEDRDRMRDELPHLYSFSFKNGLQTVVIGEGTKHIDVPITEFVKILEYIKAVHPHLLK